MKYIVSLLLGVSVLFGSLVVVDAASWVNGYTRKDGTYVSGHYRSTADGNPYNNWSFPGNTNPYTGVTAGGNPDTYLNNYYGNSGNTYTLPSPTPQPSTNYYYTPPTPTSNSFSDLLSAYRSTYLSNTTCPVNSTLSGSNCYCNSGFHPDYSSSTCLLDDEPYCKSVYGNRANLYEGVCHVCPEGYMPTVPASDSCLRDTQTATLQMQINALLKQIADLQYQISLYQR